MSKQLAVATGLSQYKVSLTPEATEIKQQALEAASLVVTVQNPSDQTCAVEVAGKLKQFSKQIEETRKELKAPLLAAGAILDDTARDAIANVTVETKRIEKLLADYHIAQENEARRLREEQERKAAELRRQQEEAARKERERIEELERQKLAAERQALEARSKKAREAAAAEAKRLQDEQTAAELEQDFREEPAPPPAYVPPPETVKPKGASVRTSLAFEITDAKALYATLPWLFELTPRVGDIKTYINALPKEQAEKIQGIRVWEETKVAAMAAKRNLSTIGETRSL